jgi:predicted RND superfamily exporter protein
VLHGVIVFLTASFCQAVLLAVIYYSGQRLSALLIVLPPLVQVLSVSGGIHLMNYYLNSLASMPPRQAAIDAFHKGWLPSLLSLGTTAIGTASLMVSGLEPIRLFGVYGTVGVLLTCATVLTIIPCSMILLGRKSETRTKLDHNAAKTTADHSGVWFRLTRLLQTRNTIALVLLMGLMTAGLFGLPKLRTSIRIETLFAHDSRIMLDYHWLEEHLGPLVPIEVLVMFSDESNLNDRLRMNLLWHINDTIVRLPHIQSSTSALTVFPPLPKMKSLPETMRLAMLNKAIHQARPAFQQMAMLRDTADGEVWRITAHISALETLDYGEILQSVRASINQTLQQESLKSSGATVLTSGIMPLVHQIQGQLLNDLFYSLLSALGVITLTMTIVEAGLLSGLITMLSNVFPVIIMFGCMGWLQHPMDIGSVMTASVALGIAVDDTLHFLAFFRRSRSLPEATRFSAVLSAYQHCGPAMIQTSLSCGLGLLVFALSDFLPTSRFAVMMSGLLLLALLGDLLLLPALLLSPAGRFFETHEQPPLSPADGDSSPQVDDGAFV